MTDTEIIRIQFRRARVLRHKPRDQDRGEFVRAMRAALVGDAGVDRPQPSLPRVKWLERPDP